MFEQVRKALADQLRINEDQITLESKLIEDLGADSLDLVEMVMFIEDKFNTEVPDEATEHFKTVQDVVDFLETL